jgi:mannose-1-phosphate guanylyltransferase/mannose-6-phosphate isomerase
MAQDVSTLIPVLLSGGSGTRLWPMSRELMPKQFLPVASNKSLFQLTLERLNGLATLAPIIVCNQEHRFLAAEQLRGSCIKPQKIILEPIGRNTAPAIALAALAAMQNHDDPLLLVLPSDHLLEDKNVFCTAISEGIKLAAEDYMVTFGITISQPETAYGHIQLGDIIEKTSDYRVKAFIEKPEMAKAQAFYSSGGYVWNSGMFLFKASCYLTELKQWAPDILTNCENAFQKAHADEDFLRIDETHFTSCRSDSIDYAIMEHTAKAVVVPLATQWSDVGSWASLWEAKTDEYDDDANVKIGDVILEDVRNCYIHAENRLVVALGIENCVIVETADAILVVNKDKSQEIKKVVSKLKSLNREEILNHVIVNRPWGTYQVLMKGPHFKVKKIIVYPQAKLSLQSHEYRAEHWVITAGTAEIVNGEQILQLTANQSTYIPAKTKHRLSNNTTQLLELIEVQTGDYLDEDDIERYDDVYGRAAIINV